MGSFLSTNSILIFGKQQLRSLKYFMILLSINLLHVLIKHVNYFFTYIFCRVAFYLFQNIYVYSNRLSNLQNKNLPKMRVFYSCVNYRIIKFIPPFVYHLYTPITIFGICKSQFGHLCGCIQQLIIVRYHTTTPLTSRLENNFKKPIPKSNLKLSQATLITEI